MIQIAVLGYGTVGSGVVEVIHTNFESIKKGQEMPLTLSMYWIFGNSREVRWRIY